jgi:hypothetical protein
VLNRKEELIESGVRGFEDSIEKVFGKEVTVWEF